MGLLTRTKTGLVTACLKRWVTVPNPRDHPQVTVGPHTYGLGPFSIAVQTPEDCVRIGSFCSFARGSRILGSGEHFTNRVSTYPLGSHMFDAGPERDTWARGPVVIGHDTWVGANAIILSGAEIGCGVVIGAGAVVSGRVEDYAVVAGVPARPLRYRFGEAQRKGLLEIAWWDWPDDVITERLESFYGSVDSFIEAYGA